MELEIALLPAAGEFRVFDFQGDKRLRFVFTLFPGRTKKAADGMGRCRLEGGRSSSRSYTFPWYLGWWRCLVFALSTYYITV